MASTTLEPRPLRRADRRFAKRYLAALLERLPPSLRDEAGLLSAILRTAEQARTADGIGPSSPATHRHHWAACLVLASDRVLEEHLPDRAARLEPIREALLAPGSGFVRFLTQLMLRTARDRFRTLTRYAERQVPARYGDGFEFVTLVSDERVFVQGVTRCFYDGYFRNAGRPYLTGLFCEVDRLWIDEIEPARDGVRFRRPMTLAEGHECCRFEFHRVGPDEGRPASHP